MEFHQRHRNHQSVLRRVRFAKALIAVASILFLQGCVTYQDVDFKGMDDVKVEKFSKDEIRLRLVATVGNPNNYNIKIKKTDLDVFVSGKEIGKARIEDAVVLKKNSTQTYEVVVITDLKKSSGGLMALAGSALLSGKAEVRAKGYVKAGAFGISKKVKLDEKKTFPISPDMLKGFGG